MDEKTKSRQAPVPSSLQERPTLKTIAFMTGLGITTVSRALKDAPDIGAETKERVRLVAKQVGYQPNRAGVRLRTGKTNVISLILNLEEEFIGLTSPMVIGISEILATTQYHLVITPYSARSDPLDPVRYVLETGAADGVIISRTEPKDPRVALMMERNFPFGTHGRTEMGLDHPYHDFDNERFAYDAVRMLVERGRRRIMLLHPPPSLTYHMHMRSGFERGLRDFGATAVPFNRIDLDNSLADIRAACTEAMQAPDAPDGVISGSGGGGVALVAGIEAAGLKLARDVDMVSKQSNDFLQWLRPEVITLREDFRLAGRELAKAVIARIEGQSAIELQTLSFPVLQN
ncbi:LacI family transcriptional regulator [Pararhizobium sp. BT-229]|uniref:LacI family transcriptional regulator n=1 Tax=Pararhizobium sp. BT-229 TaxID=2986923 RepID=UPI0021F6F93F|nr:LacI family transcriptional regulator [Pararhizobium sp. BT-229]MCV9960825.1 LacI family transcriptional regulator [Pararhizobium sp. BT-229]